ncbi:hypothetical protein Aduo_018771 [Ancylostoma duodenale]
MDILRNASRTFSSFSDAVLPEENYHQLEELLKIKQFGEYVVSLKAPQSMSAFQRCNLSVTTCTVITNNEQLAFLGLQASIVTTIRFSAANIF